MARGTGRAWQLFNVGQWQAAGGRPQTVACRWLGLERPGRGEGAAWTAMIDLAQAGASWTVGGRAGAGRGLIGRDREGTTLSGGEDTSTAWSRRRSVAGGQGGDEIGAGLGQDWDTGGTRGTTGTSGVLGDVLCLACTSRCRWRRGLGTRFPRSDAWLLASTHGTRGDWAQCGQITAARGACLLALLACWPACLLACLPGLPF
jgi:hypothetical protein